MRPARLYRTENARREASEARKPDAQHQVPRACRARGEERDSRCHRDRRAQNPGARPSWKHAMPQGMNACQMGMKTAGAASRLLPAFPKPRPRAPAPAERKPTENRRSESALPRSRPGHLHFPRSRPRREKNRRWENSVPRQKKAGAPYTAKNGVPPSVGGSASLKGGPPHRRISTGRRRSGLDVILAGPP